MSLTAQQQLNHLITEYGPELSKEPRRVKALLLDVCAENRREANVLIAAAEQGISSRLYHDGGKTPSNIITPRLVDQLHNELGIERTLAEWAVNVWRACLVGIEKEVNTNLPTNSHKPVSTVKAVKTLKKATPRVVANVNNRDSKPLVDGKPYRFGIVGILVAIAILLLPVTFIVASFFEAEEASPFALMREEFRIASEQGDAEAQYQLAYMYREGVGGEQSDEKAVFWYRSAALYGNAKAEVFMGWLHQEDLGAGVPGIFNERAVAWRVRAEMLNKMPSIEKNDEQAIFHYRKAAEQGNADGQYLLGLMYEDGVGVEPYDNEAIAWYRTAAELGSANGQYLLGWVYENGIGVEKNNEQAVSWYRKAAEQGIAAAQNNLGDMYWNGSGVEQSDEQSVAWYRLAAEQGHAPAQKNLGFMYQDGYGVEQSDEQAVTWYRKAAEQGNAAAQNNLGFMYRNGYGVDQSDEQAAVWYRKAAEQGNVQAQNNLGWTYESIF